MAYHAYATASDWLPSYVFYACVTGGAALCVATQIQGYRSQVACVPGFDNHLVNLAAQDKEPSEDTYGLTVTTHNNRTFIEAARRQIPTFLAFASSITTPCSLEISIRQVTGPSDLKFGIWWSQDSSGQRYIMAINSNGYARVWLQNGEQGGNIREWGQFPRIHKIGEINVLKLDVNQQMLTLRVNDEFLTQFDSEATPAILFGVYVEASPASEVDIMIQDVTFRRIPTE